MQKNLAEQIINKKQMKQHSILKTNLLLYVVLIIVT